ncbi:MAG TPA: transporter substrate-binding domain-containing protein [Oscillospiraceae bacterium]|nr:transporter substrate-binding domain-containing protein [Oscillospiraceae bacterium]HPF55434.1 transporter substrate-binding domain-containing protein [Clostridiales bacterium]HPK36251.1 transporter substrate-binding domain-containing protein [Oscillospiraceae bacterium]HPR75481.1 transporter substrate-binding domain-containing protein [Oscillospiraceae bacterium]
MKKFLAIFLTLILATIGFAGCAGTGTSSEASSVTSTPSSVESTPSETSSVDSVESSVPESSEASSVVSEESSEAGSAVSSEESSAVSSEEIALTEIDAIKAKGYLTVYTNAAFAPYEYYSGTEITGVDIEIAKAIAAKLGVELKVSDVEFNNIIAAVKEGKCDLGISGFSVTDERKESVNFSVEYVQTQQYIVLLADDTITTNFETLAGAKIGVQLSTTGDYAIDDAIANGCLKDSGASLIQYKNALEATVDLKNGKIDAVVIDKDTAMNIVNSNEGLKAIPLNYADGTFDAENYAIAIAKENTALKALVDEVLTELINNGSIANWMIQYSADSAA